MAFVLIIAVWGCGPGRQSLRMEPPAEEQNAEQTQEDEAYRQQILDLLDGEKPVEEEAAAAQEQQNAPIDQSLYHNAKNQVDQLQRKLNERNTTIDSMKSILRQMDNEIGTLEYEIRQQPEPTQSVAAPERAQYQPASGFQASYQEALALFNAHNYRSAQARFASLLAANPAHEMADNCQYWIGETYFARKQYANAIAEFMKVLTYAATDKHDDAQLMIAMAYYKMGENTMAVKELKNFMNHYPYSEYYRSAQKMLDRIT